MLAIFLKYYINYAIRRIFGHKDQEFGSMIPATFAGGGNLECITHN